MTNNNPNRRFSWRKAVVSQTKEIGVANEEKLDQSMKAARGEISSIPARPKPSTPTPPRKPTLGNVAKAAAPTAHKAAAVKAVEIKDDFEFDTAMHFAFVGAGQGGGKIAQSFWDIGYRRVAAFNTTDSDFTGLASEMPKLSLDIGGAAKNMQLARDAMRGRDEDVWDLFTRAWGTKLDCALVCIGLGGGSGSGAGLQLVQLARKYMETRGLPARVGAIVSLPSVDEGQQVCRNAVNAFKELVEAKVSPLIVIDNDSVDLLYSPPMSQLLPKSNELVSQLLHLFNQLAVTKSPHVTFDRAEFAQLLDGGIIVMGSADLAVENITGPADVSQAIKEQLANSVLAKVDLTTGKKAACIFVASPSVLDSFGKEYFAAGFTMLNRIVGSAYEDKTGVVVHRGIYPESEEGLQCYTLISELSGPSEKLQALAKEAGIRNDSTSIAKHLRVE